MSRYAEAIRTFAIENSPTELFLAAMHREVEADPGVTFFLATDSPQEEYTMQAAFPNHIVTHEKQSLHRDDPAAIKDAVIDLFVLSKCRKIIGKYGALLPKPPRLWDQRICASFKKGGIMLAADLFWTASSVNVLW